MIRMVRNIFVFGIVNIFLMLFVNVVMEYNTLSNRLQQLENVVSTSVETAADLSMASEELFSEKFSKKVYSASGSLTANKLLAASAKIRFFRNGSWITGNPYIMAFYMEDNGGEAPTTQTGYDSYASSFDEDDIFERLFGGVQSEYTNGSLAWANKNWNTKAESAEINGANVGGTREPTEEFREFYNRIGCNIISYQNVKKKAGTDSFKIEKISYPTLANMGLKLAVGGSGAKVNRNDMGSIKLNVNKTDSTYALDNWHMSAHVGKKVAGGTVTSKYYLTPYSLGVTYVPTNVFKTLLQSHLEQMVRFSKIKSGNISDDNMNANINWGDDTPISNMSTADGCIPTAIYNNGVYTPHVYTGDSIVNDGYVEYDLDSLQVKVDYQLVDFYKYDNKTGTIVNRLLGSKSGFDINGAILHSYNKNQIINDLKNSDTSTGDKADGYRIVARISAKIKVHIPYQSSIMQWMSKLEADASGDSESHYGIRQWNQSGQNIVENNDDLWYQYTTFRAISR